LRECCDESFESGETVFKLQGAGLRNGFSTQALPRLDNRVVELWPFRAFTQLNDAGIRDLPAEGLYLALLLVAFFEEDGFSRIGGQVAGGRQDNVSGAVGYFDATSEQS
jgi:hypothetical protein